MTTILYRLGIAGAATIALLLVGCTEENGPEQLADAIAKKVEPLQDQALRLEKRMRVLETENKDLRAELQALAAAKTAPEVAATTPEVSEDTEALIEAKLEDALGSQAQISSYFAQVAQQQIAAHEEQKRLAAEKEREERRAEEERRREERETERMAAMSEQLGLDPQQAEQLQVARASMREAMGEIFRYAREEGNFDRDQMREVMEELRNEHSATLSSFMNEEQLKTYQEQNDRGQMGGGRGGRGGGR